MALYTIHSRLKEGTATLFTRVYRKSLNLNILINTGIEVNIKAWNAAQRNNSKLLAYYATEEGKKVLGKQERVNQIINDCIKSGLVKCNDDKQIIIDKINEIRFYEERKILAEIEQQKREEDDKRLYGICAYYDYYLAGISDGTILKRKGESYKDSSVIAWKDFGKYLKGYTPETMTFDEITKRFADGFVVYLQGLGLMPETVNKQVLRFRALCNAAAVDEKNKNLISVKVWKERTTKDKDKRAEIALSDAEIDALYNMPLTGIREKVRDIWCLGFFSGQRVSDYARFTKENFKTTKSGVQVIALTQQKTGNEVIVPVIDDRVNELCEKYDYNFPKLDRRTINRYIKECLKELSLTVPSLQEWVRTTLSLAEVQKEERFMKMKKKIAKGQILHGEDRKVYAEWKEYADEHQSDKLWKRDYSGNVIRQRWELVSCHTSRRSAVTSLYDTGLYDTREIMSISGHTTLTNFEKYIKRGSIEQAERIAAKASRAKEKKMKKQA